MSQKKSTHQAVLLLQGNLVDTQTTTKSFNKNRPLDLLVQVAAEGTPTGIFPFDVLDIAPMGSTPFLQGKNTHCIILPSICCCLPVNKEESVRCSAQASRFSMTFIKFTPWRCYICCDGSIRI